MKITIVMGFFLPVPPLAGGATEKIWHRLAQLMAEAGHDVTLVSRRWPGLPDRETVGRLTHLRVRGMNHTARLAFNLVLDLLWSLRVSFRLPHSDIIICNTVALPAYIRFLRPSVGRVAAVLGRMPKGQTRVYGNVDLILATSEAVAARVRAESPRVAERTAVFPNPIDWHLHAAARARASQSTAALTIGYVGRIHPEKGLGLLLSAAAHLLRTQPMLPPWRLALIGPWTIPQGGGGEAYRASLEREFAPRLGDRLAFHAPEFDPTRLAHHYAAMDIFCYPSLAEAGETFGISVAEAMASGVAPIVSGLTCFRGLVEDGVNGLVFDHTGADASDRLASSLGHLLADASLRRSLAARAQAHAQRYDFPASANAILGLLTATISRAT